MRICEDCKKRPATFFCPDFGDLCYECKKVPPGYAIRGLPIDYKVDKNFLKALMGDKK